MVMYLIHDDTLDEASLSEFSSDYQMELVSWPQRDGVPPEVQVFIYLNDERVKQLIPLALERQWQLALLANPEAKYACRALGVKGNVKTLIDHYAQTSAVAVDVLTCNEQFVLSSVAIGEVHSLRPYDANRHPISFSTFFHALKAVKKLRLHAYTLTTGKEQKIRLAALGMVIVEQTQSSLIGRCFTEVLSFTDGRLALLIFSPRSVLGYLWFLIRLVLPKNISFSCLPGVIGLIRSQRITLEAEQAIDYLLDGVPVSAKTIDFAILDTRLQVLPGPALSVENDPKLMSDKDNIKLSQIPVEETARQMAETPLPFFSRAREEEHRDLFVSLRDNARTSSVYLVLMILSVLLALTGMYANSAPVIIGAMILAPLMAPIISLAMGLARTDSTMIRNSMKTLIIGIGAALFCAIVVAWIMPLENLTNEMRARMSPTLLDLSVAIISGIAGAYAHAKEEVAKSLAGVAIAVALVPPLSVMGIGIGWADWAMARGAFLLFMTNMFGIALAASVTFLAMGFAPFKMARKGLAISVLLLAGVIIPLYIAFEDLVEEGQILRQIPVGQIQLLNQAVNLRIIKVKVGETPLVRVILSASQRLDERHVDELKQRISQNVGRAILLEAQINLRR